MSTRIRTCCISVGKTLEYKRDFKWGAAHLAPITRSLATMQPPAPPPGTAQGCHRPRRSSIAPLPDLEASGRTVGRQVWPAEVSVKAAKAVSTSTVESASCSAFHEVSWEASSQLLCQWCKVGMHRDAFIRKMLILILEGSYLHAFPHRAVSQKSVDELSGQ